MLYLFGPKETDFINGDSALIHNTYDEVVDRSKGFYLKFKIALDKDESYKEIKKEMIISAYTPDGWNQFRVFDIYNHTNHVEVVATQLHYDLNYKKVFPFVVNKTTAQTALNVFVENFKSDLPNFKFTSNINDVHSFSTDDDLERLEEGHNALEILNRIATRWGGELKVDGYNVHLTHKLGEFTNALLYEHKNISEFVDETSMSEIVTRIHAVSRFRPEREEGSTEEPKEVTIKVVVDSPLINEYAQVYEEDYTNNDARTRDQLIAWARLKYTTNNIDKPARSIQVETNIIDGQEINYGDDLVLKYTKHDVDEIIRCVGYQYNPNSRQYISVTLGSNLNSLASTITGSVHDSTKNQLSNIEKQVQIIKYASNNHNRVTTGPLPIPDPIEGDMWYYHPDGRPNDVELRIFQDGGWVTLISDMTGENVRRAIADLELEAEGLAEDILASDQKAAAAKEEAGLAKSAVDAFGIITQETADKMVDVEQIAADAETNASNALADASAAKTQAGQAKTDATDALAKARESVTNSSGALALAGQAATDASTAISDAATAHTDAQTAISNAQSALSKASGVESTVSTLSKEVDEVAGKVELKADQTAVDTISGTVSTHTTTLSQHATAISSKAAQTEVDAVKGTVSTHTSTLEQHAEEISARLTQTQVDNLVSGKGYSTVSYVDAEMTATASAIRTEMTAVEGKIPTQIGGRNLLLNTDGTTTVEGVGNIRRWYPSLERNSEYVFSVDVKGSQNMKIDFVKSNYNRPVDTVASNGKTGSDSGGLIPFDVTTSFQRIWVKIKTRNWPSETDANGGPSIVVNSEGILSVRNPKLEKGNIATDWTPAPEDMLKQNDFNAFTAEYEQSAQGWSAKLLQIEQANYATQTWSNETFATPQSITTALQSYAKTDDLNGLATESYVGTQISTTAGAIRTEMTAIEGKIPTEIGTRNLLKNSKPDTPIVTASYDMHDFYLTEKPVVDETYTFVLKGELAPTKTNFTLYNSGGTKNLTLLKKDGEYYVSTFAWTNTAGSTTASDTFIRIYQMTNAQTGTSTIEWVTLMKGDAVIKDWTPAPEDLSEIGGRNLIKGSSKPLILAPKNTGTSSDNYNYANLRAPMTKDETYTLSFNIEITHGAFDQVSIYPQYPLLDRVRVDLVNNRGVYTFKAVENTDSSNIFIYAGISGQTKGNGFVLTEYQLEKGSVVTDWSPAPEDMMQQSDFNTFKAEYDQSAQGWSSKILQIEQADYASKTWSNQTFATPQSVSTQLTSYAKTTDLNGLATESYVGSQISATAEGIRSEVTKVEGKIDGLEIGGRNIVLNSLQPTYTSNYQMRVWQLSRQPVGGETYTFSAENAVHGGSSGKFIRYFLAEVTNPELGIGWGKRLTILDYSRYYHREYVEETVTIPGGGDPNKTWVIIAFLYPNTPRESSDNASIYWVKLEKGHIATDYTQAPEDTTEIISNIQSEWSQTFDTFEQTITGEGGINSRLQTLDNTMSTIADPVTGRLSIVEQKASGLQSAVYNSDGSSKLTQLATGLSSVVSDLDSLEIADRNLLKNSNFANGLDNWQLSGSTSNVIIVNRSAFPALSGGSNLEIIGQVGVTMTAKNTYYLPIGHGGGTYSIKVRINSQATYETGPNAFRGIYVITREPYRDFSFELPFNSVAWEEVGGSFEVGPDVKQIEVLAYVRDMRASVRFDEFQLSKGTRIGQWSPAPEDMATSKQVSSIKQTADSIQALVGTTKESVASAVMTSNLWETEVSKVIDDELEQEYKYVDSPKPYHTATTSRSVSQGTNVIETYLPLGSDGVINGSRLEVDIEYETAEGSKGNPVMSIQLGTAKSVDVTVYHSMKRAKFHLFVPQATVHGDVLKLNTSIADAGTNRWGYITRITVSTVERIEVPIDGTSTGAISSKITQLYDMINLSVLGKEGALSRISMGEEGIQIDGKLLHITARTFIDDAVIKSAMINTLDAGKITTGELNANNVRVINLDANSISGNEASFISAMFTARHSALQITGSGITVSKSNGNRTFEVDSNGAHFYSDTGAGAYITTHNVLKWTGSSWVDTGSNSVLFASEIGHSIGLGYKIYSGGQYVTRDAIRLDRSGSGVPELQVNLPIKNVDYQRGMVSGENGTYFRNTQDSAGIWMGDNGKLCLITYGKLYNSTAWLN